MKNQRKWKVNTCQYCDNYLMGAIRSRSVGDSGKEVFAAGIMILVLVVMIVSGVMETAYQKERKKVE